MRKQGLAIIGTTSVRMVLTLGLFFPSILSLTYSLLREDFLVWT